MNTKYEVIEISIGCIVDFIDQRIRCRGLVIDMKNGICHICVIGTTKIYEKVADDCTPVRSMKDFLSFTNPK